MCAPAPPAAPDYKAAAQAQGTANKEAAVASSNLNNPNVTGPYGTTTYTQNFDQGQYDQATRDYQAHKALWDQGISWDNSGHMPIEPSRNDYYGRPTMVQTLSPDQQALLDSSNRTKLQLSNLAGQGATAAQGVIGRTVDFDGAPALSGTDFTAGATALPGSAEATRNKVIDSMMSRVNQDTDIARDNRHSELIAAGIRPGTKAYNDAMMPIDRGYNDARQQAILAGGQEASRDFGLDLSRRQQGISEAAQRFGATSEARRQAITELLSKRQIPLNEITALMSGSQVSNPFSNPGYAQNAHIAAAPVYQATSDLSGYNTDLYNVAAQQAGNLQKGLFSLGAAGLGAYGAAQGGGK